MVSLIRLSWTVSFFLLAANNSLVARAFRGKQRTMTRTEVSEASCRYCQSITIQMAICNGADQIRFRKGMMSKRVWVLICMRLSISPLVDSVRDLCERRKLYSNEEAILLQISKSLTRSNLKLLIYFHFGPKNWPKNRKKLKIHIRVFTEEYAWKKYLW